MKKFVLVSLLLSLSIGFVLADDARSLYMEYLNEPCTETFLGAFMHIKEVIEADTTGTVDMMYFYLMHLHRTEMDRQLNHLIENVEAFGAGVRRNIADTLMGLGRLDQAIEIYRKAIEASPQWSCAWRHKGEAYFRNNDLPNAEIALRAAIQYRQTHYDAYIMLAEVQFLQDRPRQALISMEKAFLYLDYADMCEDELYTDEDTQFLHLKILQANRGRRSEARALEQRLRASYPDNAFWKRR